MDVVDDRSGELQFEAGGWCAHELQSYLRREFAETPVEYIAEPGEPANVIDRVARERSADLIVIAGHNRGPFAALALGSVTADVLSSAPCPVLVSLHEERGPCPLFRRILCPVELSDARDAHLDWALRFVHALDAGCDVICVAAKSDPQEGLAEDSLSSTERARLEAIRKRLDGGGRVILAAGDPTKTIAAASGAMQYDLLVARRDRSRDELARVHSLPFTLARLGSCPVVVT